MQQCCINESSVFNQTIFCKLPILTSKTIMYLEVLFDIRLADFTAAHDHQSFDHVS
jgi:hypothetical protein